MPEVRLDKYLEAAYGIPLGSKPQVYSGFNRRLKLPVSRTYKGKKYVLVPRWPLSDFHENIPPETPKAEIEPGPAKLLVVSEEALGMDGIGAEVQQVVEALNAIVLENLSLRAELVMVRKALALANVQARQAMIRYGD